MAKAKQDNPSKLNPALSQLQILIGEWNVEVSNASFLPSPTATQTGRASFEWLEGAFIVVRDTMPPQSTSVIGRNESLDTYSLLYYDDLAHEWVAEAGEFEVLVGASSQDIRATATFTLTATTRWPS